jgi:hypothetical protein
MKRSPMEQAMRDCSGAMNRLKRAVAEWENPAFRRDEKIAEYVLGAINGLRSYLDRLEQQLQWEREREHRP